MTRTLRDSEECLQRMDALVRRMAAMEGGTFGNEARAIVAELDGPKTDEEWAEKLCKTVGMRALDMQTFALQCIAKGRELEFERWEPYIDLNAANIAEMKEAEAMKDAMGGTDD